MTVASQSEIRRFFMSFLLSLARHQSALRRNRFGFFWLDVPAER
jgi:hypothetical protein